MSRKLCVEWQHAPTKIANQMEHPIIKKDERVRWRWWWIVRLVEFDRGDLAGTFAGYRRIVVGDLLPALPEHHAQRHHPRKYRLFD